MLSPHQRRLRALLRSLWHDVARELAGTHYSVSFPDNCLLFHGMTTSDAYNGVYIHLVSATIKSAGEEEYLFSLQPVHGEMNTLCGESLSAHSVHDLAKLLNRLFVLI